MGSTEKSAASKGMRAAIRGFGRLARTRRSLRNAFKGITPVSLGLSLTAAAVCLALVVVDMEQWQRAVLAGGALLLLVVWALRRRQAGPPEGALDTLLAAVPFGVAFWNSSGSLVSSNEAYRQRLAAAGSPTGPGSYHETLKRWSAGGYMRLLDKNTQIRVIELHRPDGSCLKVEEAPIATGGFVVLVTDVSAEKETDLLLSAVRDEQRRLARRFHEEKLKAEAASRSKTSFLAHLSHDIRTPLNHIIGFADLIGHQTYGPLGDERYLDYVEAIKLSGEKLLASFAEILDLAELESGQKVLRSEQVQADDLIEATARRFAPQAARAGLIVTTGGLTGASLAGDRFCLLRMLGNLMDNAIRFTPAGGKITLAAFAASDGIVIEVSDTGIGMSEERLASLSQPFVVGDATFTRQHGGAGLGIAIARAIAELSGGHLVIDSSPALGTTVAISLPMGAVEGGQIAAA